MCEKALPAGKQHTTENATESETRGHVTLITMLTHETGVQAVLPQILLGNEHRFTRALLKSVKHEVPSNVLCGARSRRGIAMLPCAGFSRR